MDRVKLRILVTGATGFVGRALLKKLILCDCLRLRATYRGMLLNDNFLVQWISVPDLSINSDWIKVLEGVDIVIHLAARAHILKDNLTDPLTEFRKVNVLPTKQLATQAVLSGVKRFIFISTIGVYGSFTLNDAKFTEESAVNPHNFYTQSKWEAELELVNIAKGTPMDFVIVRPPMIYAEDAPGNFGLLLRFVYKGWPLPFKSLDNKRAMVSLSNFVDFILLIIWHPNAANQIFNVSDGQDISTTDLLRFVALGMRKKVKLFFFPIFFMRKFSYFFGNSLKYNQLYGSLQVNISKARILLGWSPTLSIESGLRQAGKNFASTKVAKIFARPKK